jgi:hypothetical protein
MTITRPTLNLIAKGFKHTSNGAHIDMTFTRALSTATRVNELGFIETVAADVLRHDYDPVTKEYRGWLLEGTRTNLVIQSEDMNVTWSKSGVTVAAASVAGPDGLTSGKLVEITGTSTNRLQQPITCTGSAVYTFSVYLKQADSAFTKIHYSDADGTLHEAIFAWTGTVPSAGGGSSNITSYTIEDASNGWYRAIITFTNGITTGAGTLRIYPDSAGTGTEGIYPWGAQLELGTRVSSYIPTTTIAVARSNDIPILVIDINQTAASYLIEFELNAITPAPISQQILNVYTDSNNYYYLQRNGTSGKLRTKVQTAGGLQTDISSSGVLSSGIVYKAAVAWATDDIATYLDGVPAGTDNTSTLPPVTSISLGSWQPLGQEYMFGHIRSISYWPKRLSNEELLELTLYTGQ